MTSFQNILTLFRAESVSEKEKGTRFEHPMQLYLRTEPFYASRFKTVWFLICFVSNGAWIDGNSFSKEREIK